MQNPFHNIFSHPHSHFHVHRHKKLPNFFITLTIILSFLLKQSTSTSTIIPLTYAFDPYSSRKYPIKISFNQNYTTVPFSFSSSASYLPLYNINISMELVSSYGAGVSRPVQSSTTFQGNSNNKNNATSPTTNNYPSDNSNSITKQSDSKQVVTIGLKPPSIFLTAVKSTFAIESHQIELDKSQYLQLIINDNNFVQSIDQFINNQIYSVKVMYNFGDGLTISEQRCQLIDDDIVYFDQFLILEILNTMDKRNKIKFTKDQVRNQIYLEGDVENFPKISFVKEKSIFQIQIRSGTLAYLPRPNNKSQAHTMIGYKSLPQFSKFQIDSNPVEIYTQPTTNLYQPSSGSSTSSPATSAKIIFKRTSQLYQLYLFLGYFFIFTLLFIIFSREKLQGSMKFIRNVMEWVFMNNQNARIRVLRTQLE